MLVGRWQPSTVGQHIYSPDSQSPSVGGLIFIYYFFQALENRSMNPNKRQNRSVKPQNLSMEQPYYFPKATCPFMIFFERPS